MNILKTIDLRAFQTKYSGKVRDWYVVGDKRIIITTDRISAFDVNLGYIPHKGQVLNQLSAFWFSKTNHIIQNHMVSVPDPNVMICTNAKPIPIEMIVRGYITGVTGTSIWGSYAKGERTIYGLRFPEGLQKNQELPQSVITPTTKPETGHDERLTRDEIIKNKLVPKKIYEQMEEASLALFAFGQRLCNRQGLLLVDTKYEFGMLGDQLILIDEVHTPDSSRFWLKETYKTRFEKGLEPENFDKEFLRLWYAARGYRGDGNPPPMPESLQRKVSKRYKDVYEKITGTKFILNRSKHREAQIEQRIRQALQD
jgi:phosphoribosylaminoimidazole-succinocarboxamide synthase